MNCFESFWVEWPKSPRKGAKSLCKAKWDKMKLDIQIDQILAHVRYMKRSQDWLKSEGAYIPAPLVYINQQRWDGAEIPDETPVIVNEALVKMEKHQAAPMPVDVAKKLQELKKQIRLH